MTLPDLLAAATKRYDYEAIISLRHLAPEMAALLIEAREWLEVIDPHGWDADDNSLSDLLARIDGLTDRRTET